MFHNLSDTSVVCLPVKHLFIPPLPKDNNSGTPPPPPPPPEIEDSDSQSQEEISPTSNVCYISIILKVKSLNTKIISILDRYNYLYLIHHDLIIIIEDVIRYLLEVLT